MPLPASRLILALTVWLGLGVVASLWPFLTMLWTGAGILLAALALAVAVDQRSARRVEITRAVPGRMALGIPQEIPFTLRNPGKYPVRVRLWDTLPDALETTDFPWSGVIPPKSGGHLTVAVRIHPISRGPAVFGLVHVEQRSRLGFWCRRYQAGSPSSTRVYPNYEPVVRFALLAMMNSQAQMGLRQINRPGQSRDFRQLRDYQDGDALSHIDWKATSRRLALTTREYQEQRNQTLILMVDCGRRLRAMDDGLSQFDHSLNALLLLSFIALRNGDHVGVMSFGSDTPRWLPPVKGPHAMPAILNHLYDYQPSAAPGDFGEAAESLLARWSRVCELRNAVNKEIETVREAGQVGSSLQATVRLTVAAADHALLALLRKKHLLVIASLREKETAAVAHQPVTDLSSALRYSATQHYFDERRQLHEKLHRAGILTIDAPAAQLPIALGNLYLSIKKRGTL